MLTKAPPVGTKLRCVDVDGLPTPNTFDGNLILNEIYEVVPGLYCNPGFKYIYVKRLSNGAPLKSVRLNRFVIAYPHIKANDVIYYKPLHSGYQIIALNNNRVILIDLAGGTCSHTAVSVKNPESITPEELDALGIRFAGYKRENWMYKCGTPLFKPEPPKQKFISVSNGFTALIEKEKVIVGNTILNSSDIKSIVKAWNEMNPEEQI